MLDTLKSYFSEATLVRSLELMECCVVIALLSVLTVHVRFLTFVEQAENGPPTAILYFSYVGKNIMNFFPDRTMVYKEGHNRRIIKMVCDVAWGKERQQNICFGKCSACGSLLTTQKILVQNNAIAKVTGPKAQ